MERRAGGTRAPLLETGPAAPQSASGRPRSGSVTGSLTHATGSFTNELADVEAQGRERPPCGQMLVAFLLWAPWTAIVFLLFHVAFLAQQLLVLVFRPCGGQPLVFVLRLWSPLMSFATALFVTTNTCETCYGAEVGEVETFDEFVQSFSAARRKNIRRNLKAAEEAMAARGVEATYHAAGTWRITAEHRAVIWDQCQRHEARAWGYSDILNCGKPVPPLIMYVGEIVLMLAFPCDLQTFRTREGQLVSMNTLVRIGKTYWNPNYATLGDYAKCGIYPWAIRYQLMESIRNRAHTYNCMPSMKEAKEALGLTALVRNKLFCKSWACPSREAPREREVLPEPAVEEEEPPKQPKGGKRAAAKKAKAEAAAAAQQEGASSSAASALVLAGALAADAPADGAAKQKVRSEADVEKERLGREQAAAKKAERDRLKAEKADAEVAGFAPLGGPSEVPSSAESQTNGAAPKAKAKAAVPKPKPKGKATGQAPVGGKKAAMKKAAKEKAEREAVDAAAAAGEAPPAGSVSGSAFAGGEGACVLDVRGEPTQHSFREVMQIEPPGPAGDGKLPTGFSSQGLRAVQDDTATVDSEV